MVSCKYTFLKNSTRELEMHYARGNKHIDRSGMGGGGEGEQPEVKPNH